MNKRSKRICALWKEVEDEYPDKSTEWIMPTVCAWYFMRFQTEIDHADVAEALFQEGLDDQQK